MDDNICHRAEVGAQRYRSYLEELVKERTTELTRANERLRQEIAKRRQVEQTLQVNEERLKKTLVELETTQQQVLQQERLAAVGQLAAGIAHDFNNILTCIIGFAELLQVDSASPETMQLDLARIIEQGQRGANLVRQILDFSRRSIRQTQSLNLVPFVKESVRFLRRTFPENIRISLETELTELYVWADPVQLHQILTNLTLNARDAMPNGGWLKFCLSRLILDPGQTPPCPGLTPGQWAVCSMADTGTGISADVLPRIFEPFFTTKDPEAGTGLGLAQVYGIVQQHRGYIDVVSRLGEGTTFSIYLPLQAVQRSAVERKPAEIPRGHGETVLLVEDEPEVVVAGQTMLEYLDYEVLTASNGEKALQLFADHAEEIDLVLSDVVMPGMDGISLFQILQDRNPKLKVMLMSGYPLVEEEPRELLKRGLVSWMPKPLTLTAVAQAVYQALHPGVGK